MSKFRIAFNIFFGSIFVWLVVFGIVYKIGHPWNCEQAKQLLDEASRKQDVALRKASSEMTKEAVLAAKVASYDVADARDKMNSKCEAK